MNEKNPGLLIVFVACACLIIGFGTAWVAKPVPDPVLEWTIHGLQVNGKHVDLDKLKLRFPIAPALPDNKGGKKKPGDLGAGDLGPAAMIVPGEPPCPCGESCTCSPCHCHASRPITFTASEVDESPVVTQRGGGNSKSPELFGIDTLAKAFDRFIDKVFGTGRNDGLKDEIAGGLKAWSNTFTWIVVGALAAHYILKSWHVYATTCVAEKLGELVKEAKQANEIAMVAAKLKLAVN